MEALVRPRWLCSAPHLQRDKLALLLAAATWPGARQTREAMEQSKVHPVGSGYPLAPLGIWAPPPRIKGTFKPSESTMATERGDLSHPFTPTFVSGCHSHPKPTSYRDKQKTPTGQHKAISAGGLGQLRQAGVLGLPGHWGRGRAVCTAPGKPVWELRSLIFHFQGLAPRRR